eukprot:1005171-Pyramimonas_sp.AAC.1
MRKAPRTMRKSAHAEVFLQTSGAGAEMAEERGDRQLKGSAAKGPEKPGRRSHPRPAYRIA